MNEQLFQIGVKALIQDPEGRILLVHKQADKSPERRYEGYWDIPGGRMKDESVIRTLEREVEEELGVSRLVIGELFDAGIAKFTVRGASLFLLTYRCTLPKGAEIRLSEEHDKFKWVNAMEAGILLADKFPDSLLEKLR